MQEYSDRTLQNSLWKKLHLGHWSRVSRVLRMVESKLRVTGCIYLDVCKENTVQSWLLRKP